MDHDGALVETVDEVVRVLRPSLPPTSRLIPYLERIDQSRIYSNNGPLALELECRLSEHLELPIGGLALASSGTAALVGAILASAGRAGAERPLAAIPAFTFVATAVAVELCGYRPYLIDIDPQTLMPDCDALRASDAIDRIGLVVPVAPFGRPVPQEPWNAFRDKTGIPVVIDGAASFDRVERDPGRYLGEVPTCLSFHATKSFATGEGGGVATSDFGFAMRARQAMNFGFRGSRNSRCASINGKMSEYHAAVGLAELDGWEAKRAAIEDVAARYGRRLAECGLANHLVAAPAISGTYVLFRCDNQQQALQAQNILSRERIGWRHWYGLGLHRQSYFAALPRQPLHNVDAVAPLLLGLPVAPDLSDATIGRVSDALVLAR